MKYALIKLKIFIPFHDRNSNIDNWPKYDTIKRQEVIK